MSLLQRVREAGLCPPVLLSEDRNVGDVGFDATISRVLEMGIPNSLSLRNDETVATDVANLVQMASGIDKIPGETDPVKKVASLEQRRCILLAILGSTPTSNIALKRCLELGILTSIRSWLDEILSGKIGGVDLLLFLLSSISNLPVTRTMVKDSGLGKKVGSIEKHKISAGTPNENAIAARVKDVKQKWNKSVKANQSKESPDSKKRRSTMTQQNPAKKAKTGAFSSLLKKVAPKEKPRVVSKTPKALSLASMAQSVATKSPAQVMDREVVKSVTPQQKARKSSKRVKWADHFGGNLENARQIEGLHDQAHTDEAAGPVSWTDRRKRDRLREKELLNQIKKSKLVDDDDDDIFSGTIMKATIAWHQPIRIPDRSEITKAQLDSKEIIAQGTRMMKVAPARYLTPSDVPQSPAPMSDVEQALDMTQQASAVPTKIPFFAPQQAAPDPAPAPQPAPAPAPPPTPYGVPPPPPPPTGAAPIGATAEVVQAMGLPMFLVGSNVQALQTLASTPSLLSTFIDANGMYDQQRLINLVQTLTQNITPGAVVPAQTPYGTTGAYGQAPAPSPYTAPQSQYASQVQQPTSSYGQTSYGQTSTITSTGSTRTGGYRGDQNSTAGNLHLTGYGAHTTQAEIMNLFAPYVRVDEVVMKNGFCFVNTSDPVGAKNAREALNGTLIGGMPVRISMAQRRNRDTTNDTSSTSSSMASIYGGGSSSASSVDKSPSPYAPAAPAPAPVPALPGSMRMPNIDYETVRDDRGNPATKNLFVAGYGPGTTELQLREIFGQHAPITGCVMKGNFTFVNTADRVSAVNSREALTGTLVNGGVLRINFAKESGRLGTSFDLTYGPNTLKNGANKSYYGR